MGMLVGRLAKKHRLYKAATKGDDDAVEQLLAAGVSPNWRHPVWRMTPLLSAAHEHETAAGILLVRANANVHARDRTRCTPLNHATANGMTELVR